MRSRRGDARHTKEIKICLETAQQQQQQQHATHTHRQTHEARFVGVTCDLDRQQSNLPPPYPPPLGPEPAPFVRPLVSVGRSAFYVKSFISFIKIKTLSHWVSVCVCVCVPVCVCVSQWNYNAWMKKYVNEAAATGNSQLATGNGSLAW